MKFKIIVAIFAIISTLPGCNSEPKANVDAPAPTPEQAASPVGPGGGGSTPTPTNPAVGGMSPVVGGENLGSGSGGGVGQAAKDQARNAANSASGAGVQSETSGE